jgi:hypothetical protein
MSLLPFSSLILFSHFPSLCFGSLLCYFSFYFTCYENNSNFNVFLFFLLYICNYSFIYFFSIFSFSFPYVLQFLLSIHLRGFLSEDFQGRYFFKNRPSDGEIPRKY